MVEVKQQQQKRWENCLLEFLVIFLSRWPQCPRNRAEMKQIEIIKYLELISMLIWYILTEAFDARLQLSHLTVI